MSFSDGSKPAVEHELLREAADVIRSRGASSAVADRLATAEAMLRRAYAFRSLSRQQEAAVAFDDFLERFAGAEEEDVRWLLAEASIQQAEVLRELGDVLAARSVEDRAQISVGAYVDPSEEVRLREFAAAHEFLQAGQVDDALFRLRRVIGRSTPTDASATVIDAVGVTFQTMADMGVEPQAIIGYCDQWIAHPVDTSDPFRRVAFAWLHAVKAYVQELLGRHTEAVRTIDDGLAYLGEDPGPEITACRSELLDERARRAELVPFRSRPDAG